MFRKDGAIVIDRGHNEKKFPKADYERWKKNFERKLRTSSSGKTINDPVAQKAS